MTDIRTEGLRLSREGTASTTSGYPMLLLVLAGIALSIWGALQVGGGTSEEALVVAAAVGGALPLGLRLGDGGSGHQQGSDQQQQTHGDLHWAPGP